MNLKTFTLGLGIFLLSYFSYGQITINSITPTVSDCPNNGTITINAVSGTNAQLLYKIENDPLFPNEQTSNVFSSLTPGTYDILVKDISNATARQTVTVTGNYQNISFDPISTTTSVCSGSSTASLDGNIDVSTGKAPFSWELINPSPATRPAQASSVFSNLPTGTYTIKATDACGSFDTQKLEILEAGNNYSYNMRPRIDLTSCNAGKVRLVVFNRTVNEPYTASISINDGPAQTLSPSLFETDQWSVTRHELTLEFDLASINLDDKVSFTLTDGCGNSMNEVVGHVQLFKFRTTSEVIVNADCSKSIETEFGHSDYDPLKDKFSTDLFLPVHYSAKNTTTNAVEATGSVTGHLHFAQIDGLQDNQEYEITYTDNCGNSFVENETTPEITISTATPAISHDNIFVSGCLQGTSDHDIELDGYTQNPSLTITGGPVSYEDPRPGKNYTFDYLYPKDIWTGSGFRNGSRTYDLKALTPGTYTYTAGNDCDGYINSSFTITDAELAEFTHDISVIQNCDGTSSLVFSASPTRGTLRLTGGTYSNEIEYRDGGAIQDTIHTLNPGTYSFRFSRSTSGEGVAQYAISCTPIYETIEILDYAPPTVYSYNQILCANNVFLEIIPDSSIGVPPFKYEIISGPTTRPVQTSNLFEVGSLGDYRVGIYDECGNGSVRDVSVVDVLFKPLSTDITCTDVNITYPTSSYYSYEWTKPDGTKFNSETLEIPSITSTDEGTYQVTQTISISGCQTSANAEHVVAAYATNNIAAEICPGTDYNFNGETLTTAGNYIDSVTTSAGCDSLVYLALTVKPYLVGTYQEQICPGTSTVINGRTIDQEGSYVDTLSTTDCDSIVTSTVSFLPYLLGTYQEEICHGGSTVINGRTITTSGVYKDTLSTSACDSIVTVTVNFSDYLRGITSEQICLFGHTTIEGKIYNSPGTFYDTLFNGSCDSILQIDIEQVDYLRNTENFVFCEGESVSINGTLYSSAGTYRDTIATTFCDSIATYVVAQVSNPTISIGNDTTLCENNSITYTLPNTFSTYTWNNVTSTSNTYTTNQIEDITVSVRDYNNCEGEANTSITDIKPLPILSAQNTYEICYGESLNLVATGGDYYAWQHSESTFGTVSDSPESFTTYYVRAYNEFGCPSANTEAITVTVNPIPTLELDVERDIIIQEESTQLYINSSASSFSVFESVSNTNIYNGASNTVTISPSNDTYYNVTATLNDCSIEESIEVAVVNLVNVQSIISPNGDGLNDIWIIESIEDYPDARVILYNRWGNPILDKYYYQNDFDGRFDGEELPEATYYYVIELNFRDITYKGALTIVR